MNNDVTNGQLEPPTVREIVRQYLQNHGHDGLCNPSLECGCGIDDLMPCLGTPFWCQPAKRTVNEYGEEIFVLDDRNVPNSTVKCGCCHQVVGLSQSVLQNGQELCKECSE